jgi:hypothetical protein
VGRARGREGYDRIQWGREGEGQLKFMGQGTGRWSQEGGHDTAYTLATNKKHLFQPKPPPKPAPVPLCSFLLQITSHMTGKKLWAHRSGAGGSNAW